MLIAEVLRAPLLHRFRFHKCHGVEDQGTHTEVFYIPDRPSFRQNLSTDVPDFFRNK